MSKVFVRRGVDILMTAALLGLMAYMLTGQALHEWLGAVELVLFLLHHVLNGGWLRHIHTGRYTPFRVLQTALAALLLACMLGAMASGMVMSRYVFDFLPIQGGMVLAREVHMVCGYWGFILLSAHLGLHWGMVLGLVRKRAGITGRSPVRTAILRLLAAGIAGYGIFAFCKHQMANYLFLRSTFVFFDFEQPPAAFFSEHLAMMGLWTALGHYLSRAALAWTKGSVSGAERMEA
ncbi:DUF4405 domain-containing protein [Oscillibacter sp. MSJ-2]|uniref:DUF4405 domain-containing protein n=1 Tax=Dysosmobacter acutus TaxID=2841504 RepID=A0ABS6F9Z9_9FIRM|nr:DUF4405 domain-containing protein [Dysosmobacter acutus]MBU5626109.1 DUF4405 domain-containing protein [Dysosmobacter acutus]